jgi:hypothetical protein
MEANAGGYGRKIWPRHPLSIVAVELGRLQKKSVRKKTAQWRALAVQRG